MSAATVIRPAAVPASQAGDEPLRLPEPSRRGREVRIEAGRQLRMSLWLMLVIGIAFAATLAARPQSDGSISLRQEPAASPSQRAVGISKPSGLRFALAESR